MDGACIEELGETVGYTEAVDIFGDVEGTGEGPRVTLVEGVGLGDFEADRLKEEVADPDALPDREGQGLLDTEGLLELVELALAVLVRVGVEVVVYPKVKLTMPCTSTDSSETV